MKATLSILTLLLALSACKKPDWVRVDLPPSPDGAFKAKLETLSEGGGLHVSRQNEEWSEVRWLSYGQCAGAELYWSDNDTLVVAYDRIELNYFVDHHWGGAAVRLCNKTDTRCPPAKTKRTPIPSCYELQT